MMEKKEVFETNCLMIEQPDQESKLKVQVSNLDNARLIIINPLARNLDGIPKSWNPTHFNLSKEQAVELLDHLTEFVTS